MRAKRTSGMSFFIMTNKEKMIVLKSRNIYNFVIPPNEKKNKYSQADQGSVRKPGALKASFLL